MQGLIINILDFFYPLFRRFMPLQTFRYAACGGFNTVLDITLFFISYNYIFNKEVVHFSIFAVSPHIAAFLASFIVTFPIGFYYSRNIVFSESNLSGRIQLFRYFIQVVACIGLNYIFLKLFIEQIGIYPTVAKIMTTAIVVTFSYLSQKYYSFKVKTIKIHTVDGAELLEPQFKIKKSKLKV